MENKLLTELATTYQMDRNEFIAVVKQRCFKDGAASDAQLMLLLTIARKYDLNPLTKEVQAFVHKGRLEVSIGADGWSKIATRDKQFDGYETEEILNAEGELTAIKIKMYRKDWKKPGEYVAWMDEWLVPSAPAKPGQPEPEPSNWERYPRHRLFLKAYQECARFTFGITEVIDVDDAERIAAAAARPAEIDISPAPPAAIEHNGAAALPPPASVINCAAVACTEGAVGKFKTRAGEFYLCEEHRAQHEVVTKPHGRPRKVLDAAEADGKAADGGGNAEDSPPTSAPAPSAAEASAAAPEVGGPPPRPVPAAVEAQRAAGLEKIDPNEPPLETFIRAHDVPKKRVDLALAKYGAASLGELKPDQQTAIFEVFQRSYQNEAKP